MQWKLIRRPPPPSTQADLIRTTAIGKLRPHLRQVQEAHEEYVSPWEVSSDKPDFKQAIVRNAGQIVAAVDMEADSAESATLSVWQLLDRGTSVRYMQVSDDWESKTQPGQPYSGPGAGFKTGLDISRPQAGIRNRKIAEMIAEQFDPDAAVKAAFDAAFARNFA